MTNKPEGGWVETQRERLCTKSTFTVNRHFIFQHLLVELQAPPTRCSHYQETSSQCLIHVTTECHRKSGWLCNNYGGVDLIFESERYNKEIILPIGAHSEAGHTWIKLGCFSRNFIEPYQLWTGQNRSTSVHPTCWICAAQSVTPAIVGSADQYSDGGEVSSMSKYKGRVGALPHLLWGCGCGIQSYCFLLNPLVESLSWQVWFWGNWLTWWDRICEQSQRYDRCFGSLPICIFIVLCLGTMINTTLVV